MLLDEKPAWRRNSRVQTCRGSVVHWRKSFWDELKHKQEVLTFKFIGIVHFYRYQNIFTVIDVFFFDVYCRPVLENIPSHSFFDVYDDFSKIFRHIVS